jgi:hypothetical protein
MRILLTALVCISVVSCKPRNYNAGKSLAAGDEMGGRGQSLQAAAGTYRSIAGLTASLVKERTSQGYQMMETKVPKALQSSGRYGIEWTSLDSEKMTGTLYDLMESNKNCGEIFFMLKGRPAIHNPKAKCGLAQDYSALGAMVDSYYATGETLHVTDTYQDGRQMLEQYNNNAQQSKTRLFAEWSYIDNEGRIQGKAFNQSGGSCGTIVFDEKTSTVAFDSKNPCGLNNYYSTKSSTR